MPTVTLEVRRSENSGQLGFALKGMTHDETADPSNGLQIAHDLIEHVNGVHLIGTIDDELEALGATWYVRGQHCDMRRDGYNSYDPQADLAADLVRMFQDVVYGAQHVDLNPFRTLRCKADDGLEAALKIFDSDWKRKVDDWKEYCKTAKAYRYVARARMRVGYRKAYRRWEHRGRFAANTQFWAIQKAVEQRYKYIYCEGQQFILKYGNGKAECYEHYLDD